MNRLVAESYLFLIRIEMLMSFGDFQSIHELLRNRKLAETAQRGTPAVDQICHAMDMACVFYPKRVLCLQRAAATTLLLRRHGWRAETVIGAQLLPFRSHAWVELDGIVVNDKPYMLEIYQSLERC
jgi:hypothetical protein